jgi:hypothetical protein
VSGADRGRCANVKRKPKSPSRFARKAASVARRERSLQRGIDRKRKPKAKRKSATGGRAPLSGTAVPGAASRDLPPGNNRRCLEWVGTWHAHLRRSKACQVSGHLANGASFSNSGARHHRVVMARPIGPSDGSDHSTLGVQVEYLRCIEQTGPTDHYFDHTGDSHWA